MSAERQVSHNSQISSKYFVPFSRSSSTFVSPFSPERSQTQFIRPEAKILPKTETVESIYESYDPLNEAKMLQRFPQLTEEEKDYYLQENIFSYLEEFVGKIPYKQLSGVLKDDGSLEMMGMSVMDMYKRTADSTGPGSREEYEWQGLQTVHQALLQGANRGIWISPPKIANYGFVFTFIAGEYDNNLKGRPLKELILRYDEKMGSTKNSKQIAAAVSNSFGFPPIEGERPENFLSSPIVYANDTNEDINQLLRIMNIDADTVDRSQYLRKEVFPQLVPLLQQYQDVMRQMNYLDLSNESDPQVQQYNEQAKVLIGALFNGAKQLLRNKENVHQFKNLTNLNAKDLFTMAHYLAQSEALVIQGGSNCPVAKGSTMSQVSDLTRAGFSFDEGLHIISSRDNPLDVFKGQKEKWKFNKDGDCKKCTKPSTEVGKLGPCMVCEKCQEKFDKGIYK